MGGAVPPAMANESAPERTVIDDFAMRPEARWRFFTDQVIGPCPLTVSPSAGRRHPPSAREHPSLQPCFGSSGTDDNIAERAMRSVAFGRKNCLLVESQTGSKSVAIADTPIQTAKLNWQDGTR